MSSPRKPPSLLIRSPRTNLTTRFISSLRLGTEQQSGSSKEKAIPQTMTLPSISTMGALSPTPINYEDCLASKTFVFVVGKEKKEFHIHKQIIARLSAPLNVLVNGNMREACEGRVCWPDVDTDTFVRFVRFAYSETYEAAKPEPIKPEEAEAEGAAKQQQTSIGKGKGREGSPADKTAAGPSAAPANSTHPHGTARHLLPANSRWTRGSSFIRQGVLIPILANDYNKRDGEIATVGAGSVPDDEHAHVPALSCPDQQPHHHDVESFSRSTRNARKMMSWFKPNAPYSVHAWLDMWGFAERRLKEDRGWYNPRKRRHDDERNPCDDYSDSSDDYNDYDADGVDTYEDHDIHGFRRRFAREQQRRRSPQVPAVFPLPEPKSWIEESSAKSKYAVMSSFSGLRGPIANYRGRSMLDTSALVWTMNCRRKSQLPVFLSHLKLYIIADKYGVERLSALSLKRLHDCLMVYEVTRDRLPDLIALTHMVYDNTVEVDVARTLMVNFWLCFPESIGLDPGFKGLIKEQGDFAVSLISGMTTRIH